MHLHLEEKKSISIQFVPDKVIQNLIKSLPNIKWNTFYGMAFLPNTPSQLTLIFETFKGVAWVNCSYFFTNKPIHEGKEELNIDQYRNRVLAQDYKACPEEFFH